MIEGPKKNKEKPLNNWAVFTGIAFQMAVVITGGVLLGIWLDTKFENKYSAFTISCSLLGVFIALYQVYKTVKDLDNDNK
ncbi:AtpZ/AtpI family protein [Mesonia ostreae]|uniref:AtpZ/AtpI family protein n=1 Tax=Mesonia ostreae TaxID=861110 RepID=A0ABU2KIT0_9FLAO|nr:AtpZ/AtpI family protein [Mesonia ostreae]MDT0294625.1 AtpZ/AtpI family protein [Mesonia ostreae]